MCADKKSLCHRDTHTQWTKFNLNNDRRRRKKHFQNQIAIAFIAIIY